MANAMGASFEPSFIDGRAGRLFTLAYPGVSGNCRDALVVVPAFAEEMNKSRRQVALMARALQARNVTTFVPDLRGTGDSDGDFSDASVCAWRDDLRAVFDHVQAASFDRISVLAVRGGALLALDLLNHTDIEIKRTVMWQPVTVGKTMVSQFLRLKAAASLTGSGDGASVGDLRKTLQDDQSVEVAGYTLSPKLVRELDALNLRQWPLPNELHWFCVGEQDAPPLPASSGVIQALSERQVVTHYRSVAGEPFWSTAEIALAPALIEVTEAFF